MAVSALVVLNWASSAISHQRARARLNGHLNGCCSIDALSLSPRNQRNDTLSLPGSANIGAGYGKQKEERHEANPGLQATEAPDEETVIPRTALHIGDCKLNGIPASRQGERTTHLLIQLTFWLLYPHTVTIAHLNLLKERVARA